MPPASSLVLVRPLAARRVSLARTAIAAALFVTAARTTGAQTAPDQKSRFEFLVSSGTLVPTGAPRNAIKRADQTTAQLSYLCLLYTSPSPRDGLLSRMPSSA